jgi:hypothetical protein
MAITTDLSGKTAIITGSNSGIGLGIAQELAKAGADVVLNSFTDREEDHALAADIAKETGVTARYIKADMSKGDECRALIEKAGACDILINNAGIQHVAAIPDFPVEKWDAIIAINLSSAFHTTAAALPMMRAAGWGRVDQHRLGPWPDGEPLQIGLYRGQARDRGADQDHGAGDGGGADHRQRDLPGLRADPAGGGADPRHDEGIRHEPGGRDPQRDADAPALEGIRHGRADGRHGSVPVFGRRGTDHRDDDQRRWGLDGAVRSALIVEGIWGLCPRLRLPRSFLPG